MTDPARDAAPAAAGPPGAPEERADGLPEGLPDGPPDGASAAEAALELLDYRRRVAALYAAARRDDATPEARWRAFWTGRDRLFREHPQSPLAPDARADFAGAPRFPYDPALRLAVRPQPPAADAETLQLELASDGAFRMRPLALLRFDVAGRPQALTLYRIEGYGNGLFLPFADATSGRTTYGGGRYLLDTLKHADLGDVPGEARGEAGGGARGGERDAAGERRLILDFNFAYQPSCAYHPRWDCPLAPPSNRLQVAVEAGERLPTR